MEANAQKAGQVFESHTLGARLETTLGPQTTQDKKLLSPQKKFILQYHLHMQPREILQNEGTSGGQSQEPRRTLDWELNPDSRIRTHERPPSPKAGSSVCPHTNPGR